MTLPSPQPKIMPYLTIIPSRRPMQKLHTNIGHAKNAINGKIGAYRGGAECDMELLEHQDGGWVVIYEVNKGDRVAPWQVEKLAKQAEKREAAEKKLKEAATSGARKEANAAFNRLYPANLSGTIAADRPSFVAGYVEGYMAARHEYGYD